MVGSAEPLTQKLQSNTMHLFSFTSKGEQHYGLLMDVYIAADKQTIGLL